MKKVGEKTTNDKKLIIQETEICNLGSVRYKDELISDKMDPYLFSQGFKYAVRNLPQSFSSKDEQTAYMKFIENWGTVGYAYYVRFFAIMLPVQHVSQLLQHVIQFAEIGTRHMQKWSATYNKVYTIISNQVIILDMHECLLILSFSV